MYTFTVPGMKEGSAVKVNATFKLKTIGIYVGENDSDKDVVISEKNVASGDKVTVQPNEKKIKAGYKVTKVEVKDNNGKTVASSSDGSFTVPKDTDETAKLTVTTTLR